MFTIGDVLHFKAKHIAETVTPVTALPYLDEGLLNALEHPNEMRVWCKYHRTCETYVDYVAHWQHWHQS